MEQWAEGVPRHRSSTENGYQIHPAELYDWHVLNQVLKLFTRHREVPRVSVCRQTQPDGRNMYGSPGDDVVD